MRSNERGIERIIDLTKTNFLAKEIFLLPHTIILVADFFKSLKN